MYYDSYVITKRDGSKEPLSMGKVRNAIRKAFQSVKEEISDAMLNTIIGRLRISNEMNVEDVQNQIEVALMEEKYFKVAKAFMMYRSKHDESRLIKDKIKYITSYSKSTENAAANSNTDANANNNCKNVSSVEIEVFKDKNRLIQRGFMKNKLTELFPELARQYEKDLEEHIIYTHDEGSSPIPKAYCGAYTLYPLMNEGVGNVDGITPSAPNDMQSFSGQVTNLVFALSAQTKGAVAFGDYFVALNYYVNLEFGENWYEHLNDVFCNNLVKDSKKYTIKREIEKAMKQFIYGINQPQGNRGFQSPFTNLSIYDKYYYNALFDGFCYPDGTRPVWEAVDKLQRIFIALMRNLRLIKPLTFPVLTTALLYDENGYKDEDYKKLCADEWAKGSSHFLYDSDNAGSLSSCCRVANKITKNYFTSTTGMIGLMTGSCNVITINLNRVVQKAKREFDESGGKDFYLCLKSYLTEILGRMYKYHIAYKTMLYELEDLGMITYSNAGYLYIKKLYSTIGVIGYYEAAKFLGLEDNSKEYKKFLDFLMSTIDEQNTLHSIHDKKRPFVFNLEAIPGENLAVKLYNWDKEDGYEVPSDQNLYNCYFFNPWKTGVSVLEKIGLHGRDVCKSLGGGQAAHINLCEHLSEKQYEILMDYARNVGCNYFTFNIPMSECKECGHIVNAPIEKCPKCGSTHITYWTRIIGFLTAVDNWSPQRQKEFTKRVLSDAKDEIK